MCWSFETKTRCMFDPWHWIETDNIRTQATFTQLTFTPLNNICFVATWWSNWVCRNCSQTFQAGVTLQAQWPLSSLILIASFMFQSFWRKRSSETKKRLMALHQIWHQTKPGAKLFHQQCPIVEDVPALFSSSLIYFIRRVKHMFILVKTQEISNKCIPV